MRSKDALPFPDWCASGWDSIDDAFEELRQAWTFPLVVMVHGLNALLGRKPHTAFQTLIRLSDLSHSFSVASDQLIVAYVGEAWE